MSSRWPLSMALAALEGEVWSSTPLAAIGLIEPAANDRVEFHLRTHEAVSATLIDRAEFDPGCSIDAVRSVWTLGPLVRVPIGREGSELFGALRAGGSADAADAKILARLADRIDALSAAGEPVDALDDRLTRADALAGMLETLGSALDLRDVFGQLSIVARRVLPHDVSIVSLPEHGRRRIRRHALVAPEGWNFPEVIDNPYQTPLTEAWIANIIRDFADHPLERTLAAAALGLRSTVRVPIHIDNRVAGTLEFAAFEPRRYTDADIPVARRMADYIALALSHQRLSDEARQGAEIRERAANLEVLEGLLATLAGALDVRDVFDRVSAISHRVIAHDAMSISIPTEDAAGWTIHVATGALSHLATPFVMRAPTPRLLDSPWEYELVADMRAHTKYDHTPSVDAGMRALLSLPVFVECRLRSTVNFYAAEPGHFTQDDVLVGRRIADHVALALAHQRLAEESRRAAELRARAAKLDLLDELLAAVADQGELVDVFDRISAVAKRVLAHDVLVLAVALPDGRHARAYARSGLPAGAPEIVPIPEGFVDNHEWEYDLVDDLRTVSGEVNTGAAKAGYRSALRVPIRFDGKVAAALGFLAVPVGAFTAADVHVARRIADRLALALSRDRGLEQTRRADEAAARAAQLESRVRALTEELDARTGFRRVVGESPSWRQALTQAAQVAATDTTVLLLGESGTGKEVVARFVHRASARRSGPFVALNCAALPEQLLEAELFGYERGAFTGATQSKPGQLEQAAGGTLFLDEVGEMALPAQAKFLRVLQEREFQRLGGTRVLKTDARIVAATNRDLQRAIALGTFREDLFYRLNVFAIALPPLRDRRDDILPLSDAFLADIARGLGRPPAGVSKDARRRLFEYHWPGNVRELRNVLERAAILCEGGLITGEHLSIDATRPPHAPAAAPVAAAAVPVEAPAPADIPSMERTRIEQALRDARFNKSKAAKDLGLTRAQLYVRMKRYGLE